jgi:hypothetical protein
MQLDFTVADLFETMVDLCFFTDVIIQFRLAYFVYGACAPSACACAPSGRAGEWRQRLGLPRSRHVERSCLRLIRVEMERPLSICCAVKPHVYPELAPLDEVSTERTTAVAAGLAFTQRASQRADGCY